MKQLLKKPILLVISLMIAFLAILTIIFISLGNTISEDQTKDLILNRDLAVATVEQKFNEIETIILSVDTYITTQSDRSGLLDYLESIDDQYQLISSIYFGMPDKTMINSSGFVPTPPFDLTQRTWYQSALTTDNVIFTEAYINATDDRVIITGAYAVYDGDTLLGVIGVDIDIRSVTSFINDITDNAGGFGFLFDKNNNVIAHPEQNMNVILESIEVYSIPISSFTEQIGITDEIAIDDVKGVVAYDTIANTNFTLGLFKTSSQLHQEQNFFRFISLVILALLFGVGSVIVFVYKYFISKPLNNLILDIKKIETKDSYNYRFPANKKVGFRDARHALNDLLDMTVAYQKQAQQSLEELSYSNQKYNLLLESASDIVFLVDKDMKYLEIFGKGLTLLNRKEKDFIGKTYAEVFTKNASSERDQKYQLAFSGKKTIYTWKYDEDNQHIVFETAISPLYDTDNNIIGAVGVSRDITEQQLRYDRVLYISTHDSLTNLYNRRYYIEQLELMDMEHQYPFAVLNCDVNGLKIINDAYGHATGDIALIKTAEILSKHCPKEAIVSRVSGDEFTVILPNSDHDKTQKVVDKLLQNFSRIHISNINLSVAIGFFIKEDDSIDTDEVRKLAENDMFRHKISERKSVKNKAISAILKTLTEKYNAEKIHSDRVSEISYSIGKALKLSTGELKDLGTAALFHDIGKISIPDAIINKPGKLTDDEYEIIKTHTDIGYEILHAADEYSDLAIYASSHHERIDGKGYPKGLKGDEIPFFSRIIAIADSYEAMTSDRPYRKKLSQEYAISELRKYAGTQFDYDLTKLFVEEVLKENWEI